MYKQGDIVIVNFPFTDLSNSKVRPAVVISNDKINISGDYIIVMISTQEIRGDFSVNISNIDVTIPFKLPHHTMFVYCKKIATLNKCIIRKKITEIKDKNKIKEIIDKINIGIDLQ